MKTVGIIGGLGPETTAEFYMETIFGSFEQNKLARPPVLLWSVPLPYEIEQDLITKSIGEERYIPFLVDAAKRLEKGGADFIVMPCNSLHIFLNEIRASVSIPVLSILEETAMFLKNRNVTEVGVLATNTTIKSNMYEKELSKNNIIQVIPSEDEQSRIGEVINRLVRSRHNETDKKELLTTIDRLSQSGVTTIILACTDLQLLMPKHDKVQIFDTMKILSDATVNKILS